MMLFKILLLCAIIACAVCKPYATSYASVKLYKDGHHSHYSDYDTHHNDYKHKSKDDYDYDDDDDDYKHDYDHHDSYDSYDSYDQKDDDDWSFNDDHKNKQHYGHYSSKSHPKYQFKYGVHDDKTHDHKVQEEHRDGDVVKGHYKVAQPDGRTRIVYYTADKHNGFNADVTYSGHAEHPSSYHK